MAVADVGYILVFSDKNFVCTITEATMLIE